MFKVNIYLHFIESIIEKRVLLNLGKHDYNNTSFVLRQINQGGIVSPRQLFSFGLFLGFAVLSLLLIIVLVANGGYQLEDVQFKYIFPLFRGIAIFIAYVWLFAWNVYGWDKYHINYKLMFGFKYHYSRFTEVLKIIIKYFII